MVPRYPDVVALVEDLFLAVERQVVAVPADFSSAAVKTRLRLRVMLGTTLNEPPPELPEIKPFVCDHCGGALTFVREIARPHPMRGPPLPIRNLVTQ